MTEKRLRILVEREIRAIGMMELGIDEHRIALVGVGPRLAEFHATHPSPRHPHHPRRHMVARTWSPPVAAAGPLYEGIPT